MIDDKYEGGPVSIHCLVTREETEAGKVWVARGILLVPAFPAAAAGLGKTADAAVLCVVRDLLREAGRMHGAKAVPAPRPAARTRGRRTLGRRRARSS